MSYQDLASKLLRLRSPSWVHPDFSAWMSIIFWEMNVCCFSQYRWHRWLFISISNLQKAFDLGCSVSCFSLVWLQRIILDRAVARAKTCQDHIMLKIIRVSNGTAKQSASCKNIQTSIEFYDYPFLWLSCSFRLWLWQPASFEFTLRQDGQTFSSHVAIESAVQHSVHIFSVEMKRSHWFDQSS